MDLVEPEPEYLSRRRRTIAHTVSNLLLSGLLFFLIPVFIYVVYLQLLPFGAFLWVVLVLVTAAVSILVGIILVWLHGSLVAWRDLAPISVTADLITLNARTTIDVERIQGIDRYPQWKELRFRLTRPDGVVIIMENDFVRDLLNRYKAKWSVWDYKDNEGFGIP